MLWSFQYIWKNSLKLQANPCSSLCSQVTGHCPETTDIALIFPHQVQITQFTCKTKWSRKMAQAEVHNYSRNSWWFQPAYYLTEILLSRWMVERKGFGSDPLVQAGGQQNQYMLTLKNCSIIQIYGHTVVAGKMSKRVSIVKIHTLLSEPAIRYRNFKDFSHRKPLYVSTRVKSAAAVFFDWAGWQFSVTPLFR